jgi:hypothetical protein
MTEMRNAEFDTLANLGVTYGDVITVHGLTKAGFRFVGTEVRVERKSETGLAFVLIETATGARFEQGTALGRGKYWVAR